MSQTEHPHASEASILELRQYTLHPNQRDALIALFEREFIETQEAHGMTVLGQFRDARNPDLFVWLRGFTDMESRRRALEAFYTGETWRRHRDAANATMVDSDNVLLLRPAWSGSGLVAQTSLRAAQGSEAIPPGVVDISAFYLSALASPALIADCQEAKSRALRADGALNVAWYVTESRENTFPRLPVRSAETALVSITLFRDQSAFDAFAQSGGWAARIARQIQREISSTPVETHCLTPTARSNFHA